MSIAEFLGPVGAFFEAVGTGSMFSVVQNKTESGTVHNTQCCYGTHLAASASNPTPQYTTRLHMVTSSTALGMWIVANGTA